MFSLLWSALNFHLQRNFPTKRFLESLDVEKNNWNTIQASVVGPVVALLLLNQMIVRSKPSVTTLLIYLPTYEKRLI